MQVSLGDAQGGPIAEHGRFHPCPSDPACPCCAGTRPGPDWSFVDAAYCISLADRPDRMIRAAREFHRVGLCRTILFYRPDRHPTRVIEGIWESHRTVARHAQARGARTVLIFEDDVAFARWVGPRTVAAVARTFERLPPDWTIFFLGHWPLKALFVRPNLLRTSSACAHAYIASPRLLAWLAENPFSKEARDRERIAGGGIDASYARLPQAFAFFPMLATQAARGSDHMAEKKRTKRITKLKHLVTRTDFGEFLLARMMRPNELVIATAALVALGGDRLRRGLERIAGARTRPST
ncbi:MAG: hypothetical protein NZ555_10240 [Geminicoccaceae bacterium]|nr:hypothetical protein [Geminicoccaceae bacterium]MDW8369187.1 hypothetical protein [Geminicoccaceae bacterium]